MFSCVVLLDMKVKVENKNMNINIFYWIQMYIIEYQYIFLNIKYF